MFTVNAGQLVLTTADKSREMGMPFDQKDSSASVTTHLVIGSLKLILIVDKEHVNCLLRTVAIS